MTNVVGRLVMAVALPAMAAVPAVAQEAPFHGTRGYMSLFGGTVWDGDTTGHFIVEGGARVAPHLLAFGNIGRFNDLQPDVAPFLDSRTAALSAQGLDVSGSGSLPASYLLGGLRAEFLEKRHALPYVLGGLGTARLKPNEQFMFAGGALPDGTVPDTGTDVTTTLETSGVLPALSHSNAFMYSLGGGVQVPVTTHWAGDVGYRYSRIAADSALSAGALGANAMTFGFGYRF